VCAWKTKQSLNNELEIWGQLLFPSHTASGPPPLKIINAVQYLQIRVLTEKAPDILTKSTRPQGNLVTDRP
jgi:hypothetical protein